MIYIFFITVNTLVASLAWLLVTAVSNQVADLHEKVPINSGTDRWNVIFELFRYKRATYTIPLIMLIVSVVICFYTMGAMDWLS